MPTYEFTCPNEPCFTPVFDLRLPMADRNEPQRCPECGGAATRNEFVSAAKLALGGAGGTSSWAEPLPA